MIHLLLQAAANNPGPFEWAYQHMMLVGWPAIVLIAWKASKWLEHFTTQIKQTVGQIDNMATNHFPHMEASLAKQDTLLASIDVNIGRMADKL